MPASLIVWRGRARNRRRGRWTTRDHGRAPIASAASYKSVPGAERSVNSTRDAPRASAKRHPSATSGARRASGGQAGSSAKRPISDRRTGKNGGSSVWTIKLAAPRTTPARVDRDERRGVAPFASVRGEVGGDGAAGAWRRACAAVEAQIARRAPSCREEAPRASKWRRRRAHPRARATSHVRAFRRAPRTRPRCRSRAVQPPARSRPARRTRGPGWARGPRRPARRARRARPHARPRRARRGARARRRVRVRGRATTSERTSQMRGADRPALAVRASPRPDPEGAPSSSATRCAWRPRTGRPSRTRASSSSRLARRA